MVQCGKNWLLFNSSMIACCHFLEKLLGSVYICVLISVRHCHQMVSERTSLAGVNVLSPWVMHITLAVPLFPSMCINGY